MKTETTRYYYIDNIRAVLILLVIFGHLLETVEFAQKDFLYHVIYAFHMPAFAFLSGLCYKRKDKPAGRIGRFLLIYIVFQVLYVLFNNYALDNPLPFQFTTPYWILWYLVAMIFWTIAADYLDFSIISGLFVIAVSVVLALAIGYETTFGYNMSLSRIVSFFPFYITGVYISKFRERLSVGVRKIPGAIWKLASLLAVVVCVLNIWEKSAHINRKWLYDSYPYAEMEYNASIRLIFFIVAAAFIFFFMSYAFNKRIPVFSAIGKNSLTVYLLHGFVVKYLDHIEWSQQMVHPLATCILLAAVLALIFSSRPVAFAFKSVFR
jgi:fucose 4-O-acetylase-like acetyltransferase